MAKVVKRNSTIPVLQEKEFTTCVDNQSVVSKGVATLIVSLQASTPPDRSTGVAWVRRWG